MMLAVVIWHDTCIQAHVTSDGSTRGSIGMVLAGSVGMVVA